jgi:hypothetical protein
MAAIMQTTNKQTRKMAALSKKQVRNKGSGKWISTWNLGWAHFQPFTSTMDTKIKRCTQHGSEICNTRGYPARSCGNLWQGL